MWARTARLRTLNACVKPRWLVAAPAPRPQSTLAAQPAPSLFHPQGNLIRPLPTLLIDKSGDVGRWNSRLAGHADDGNVGRCLATCAVMRDEGVQPNRITYNALLRALSKYCYYDEAMVFFDEMRHLSILPDAETFVHLLHSARNSDERCVEYIVDLIRQANVPMDASIFHELITHHVLREELEMCIQRLDDMYAWQVGPLFETIESVVVLATQKGNARLAFGILDAYEKNSTRRVGGYVWMNVLISAAQSLFQEGTVEAWRKVTAEHLITPDEGTCDAVLACAARHGLPTLAAEAIKQLDAMDAPKREHHFAALVEACATAGLLKVALETLAFMRSTGVPPGKHTAAPILERLADDIQKTDDAFNLLYDLHADGKGVDVAAMNVVVAAAVAQGDLGRAVGIYKSAPDWDLKPNAGTFNILLRGCLELGQLELPDRIIDEMQELKVKPNAETFETLIHLALVPDQYEGVFFYLVEMKKAKLVPSPDVYEAVVRKCIKNNDSRFELALEEMREHEYEVSEDLQKFIDRKGQETVPTPRPPRQETLLDSYRAERDAKYGPPS